MNLGSTLTDFKDLCQTFDAYNKGLTLTNASQIRSVHITVFQNPLYLNWIQKIKRRMKMCIIVLPTLQLRADYMNWMD